MENRFFHTIATVLVVAIIGLSAVLTMNRIANNFSQQVGTAMTYNASNASYTDGADLKQNVQAMSERMANVSQYSLLQADSAGNMQAVAPSALAGTSWSFDGLYTDSLNYLEGLTKLNLTTDVTTTLTVAMSGETFFFSGVSSTAFVLPATSTSAGVTYKFVVGGALSENITVQTSDLGNNIEGTLLVAGAVVDCASEDTVTFVADGENVGDFFTIFGDGTNWYLGASGALTASKLTCSAT